MDILQQFPLRLLFEIREALHLQLITFFIVFKDTLKALYSFQVRSLAAESDRAYQGGPLERTHYQEVYLKPEEGGVGVDTAGFQLPNQYNTRLDWFAVDLEGEHSAMDGQILEEHTEYVVYAIHRVSLNFYH